MQVKATLKNKKLHIALVVTRVIEAIAIAAPRPRNIDAEPELRSYRDRLHRLFRELEPQAEAAANPEPASVEE